MRKTQCWGCFEHIFVNKNNINKYIHVCEECKNIIEKEYNYYYIYFETIRTPYNKEEIARYYPDKLERMKIWIKHFIFKCYVFKQLPFDIKNIIINLII